MVAGFALSLSVGLVLVCSLANATHLRSAGVQGWLQIAAIETATSETVQLITLVSRLKAL